MWKVERPKPVKLIVGILAADENCLAAACQMVQKKLGHADFISDVWSFTETQYYKNEMGTDVLRQFLSIERLIRPGRLARTKHKTNLIERKLAKDFNYLPRPVNLDPGIIEPSKLVLATTKNFSHRIYIGKGMYAETTLRYHKGLWQHFDYTFPDYHRSEYHAFFEKVRQRLLEQLKSNHS